MHGFLVKALALQTYPLNSPAFSALGPRPAVRIEATSVSVGTVCVEWGVARGSVVAVTRGDSPMTHTV